MARRPKSVPGPKYLAFGDDDAQVVALPAHAGWPESVHVFEERQILAVNAALASARPLLVRGEPGTGKSQLARAAAVALKRHFVSRALDARTEPADLMWRLDAVRRLSYAQVAGAFFRDYAKDGERALIDQKIAEERFVEPGVLWWAFDYRSAAEQRSRAGGVELSGAPWVQEESPGAVLLLDEIDKADPVLPNALLEALGTGRFDGPGQVGAVHVVEPGPLVVITSNEERELPNAFLRRCLVLELALPRDADDLLELLCARGQHHGAAWSHPPSEALLEEAARLLIEDRERTRAAGLSPPGQAEYLDLVRAVCRLGTRDNDRLSLLEQLRPFVFAKHPGAQMGEAAR